MNKNLSLILMVFVFTMSRAGGVEIYYELFKAVLDGPLDPQQGIKMCRQIVDDPKSPSWLKSGAFGDISVFYLDQNNITAALDAFEKAVDMGFCDPFAIHSNQKFKPLFKNNRFASIYARMRISPADLEELKWYYGEFQNIIHDTKMMILENSNRVDQQLTAVFQVNVPDRKTNSASVLCSRQILRFFHAYQRDIVASSDQQRKHHITQLQLIDNMGNGSSTSYDDILRSQQTAQENAANRQRSVFQRQFAPPQGLSNTLQPCPALGSIGGFQ